MNNVIVWSDFPEKIDQKEGMKKGRTVGYAVEYALASTYAPQSDRTKQNAQKIINKGIKILPVIGIAWLGFELNVDAESLSKKAENFYYTTLSSTALWVVAVKGAWDTVHKAIKEDFEGAKKAFISYAMIFAIVMGLPKILFAIETWFDDI